MAWLNVMNRWQYTYFMAFRLLYLYHLPDTRSTRRNIFKIRTTLTIAEDM